VRDMLRAELHELNLDLHYSIPALPGMEEILRIFATEADRERIMSSGAIDLLPEPLRIAEDAAAQT